MKQNLFKILNKIGLTATVLVISLLSSPVSAFAQGQEGGTDIGGMITNIANYLANNLQLALSAVAVVAIIANVLYSMFVGGDKLSRLREDILKIVIAYAVGMGAATIIQTISNAIGGGGSYG